MKLWKPNQIPSSGRADVGNRIPLWGRRFIQNASWRCRFVLSSKVEEHIFTLNLTLQPFSHTHSRMAIFYKCLNFWFTGFKWWTHSWLGARLQQGLTKDSPLNKQGRLSLENTFYIHIIFVGSITKYRKGLSTQVCKVDPIWATVVLVERTWRNDAFLHFISRNRSFNVWSTGALHSLSPLCSERHLLGCWGSYWLWVFAICSLTDSPCILSPQTRFPLPWRVPNSGRSSSWSGSTRCSLEAASELQDVHKAVRFFLFFNKFWSHVEHSRPPRQDASGCGYFVIYR